MKRISDIDRLKQIFGTATTAPEARRLLELAQTIVDVMFPAPAKPKRTRKPKAEST